MMAAISPPPDVIEIHYVFDYRLDVNRLMPRLTREESKARTRAKLLESAGEVFDEVGYTSATVEAIVERAGFTRGAFYANFTDKADLFLTLLEESRDADMRHATDLVDETPDESKLDAIQTWYDALMQQRSWDLAYAEFWPQATRDPNLRTRVAARQASTRQAIEDMTRSYCEASGTTLALPAEEVAGMMLAIADGIATQRHLDPQALPDNAFTTAIMYLWAGILGEAPKK
jgi:AcrR family transcriptional regulator